MLPEVAAGLRLLTVLAIPGVVDSTATRISENQSSSWSSVGKGVDGEVDIWILLEVTDVVVGALEWLLLDGSKVSGVLWDCCAEFGSPISPSLRTQIVGWIGSRVLFGSSFGIERRYVGQRLRPELELEGKVRLASCRKPGT